MRAVNAEPVVYIVDDDRSVCRSLQATLRGAGLKCRAFTSAAAFFKAYNAARPGCLLLDIRMPGESGLQVLEELQAKYVPIPVIMMTGFGGVPTAVRSLKLGATDFLEKPIDPRALVAAAQAAIAQDRQRRTLAVEVQELRRRLGTLTDRERTLLRLIVHAKSNKLIAADLGISIKTVVNIRAKLMDRMQALNVADLVRMAVLADPSLLRCGPSAGEA